MKRINWIRHGESIVNVAWYEWTETHNHWKASTVTEWETKITKPVPHVVSLLITHKYAMKTREREREMESNKQNNYLRNMFLDVGSREVLRQISDSLSKWRGINNGCCCCGEQQPPSMWRRRTRPLLEDGAHEGSHELKIDDFEYPKAMQCIYTYIWLVGY